jgi:hypothetical protein
MDRESFKSSLTEYYGLESHSYPGTRYYHPSLPLYLLTSGTLITPVVLQENKRQNQQLPRGADFYFVTEECGRDEPAEMIVQRRGVEIEPEEPEYPFLRPIQATDDGPSLFVSGMHKFAFFRT